MEGSGSRRVSFQSEHELEGGPPSLPTVGRKAVSVGRGEALLQQLEGGQGREEGRRGSVREGRREEVREGRRESVVGAMLNFLGIPEARLGLARLG